MNVSSKTRNINRRSALLMAGAGCILPLLATSPAIASPEERFAKLLAEMTPSEFEALVDNMEAKKSSSDDPLPAMVEEWRTVRDNINANHPDEDGVEFERLYALEDQISQTRAKSSNGVLSQFEFALEEKIDMATLYQPHQRLLENIRSSLRILAGEARYS